MHINRLLSSSLRQLPFALALAGSLLLSASVGAGQSVTGAAPAVASGDILVRSSVPGATPLSEPGPNTPVPAWAQQSYADYLAMKGKAHGGTPYTRATMAQMPDWSGIWEVTTFTWDDGTVPHGNNIGGPEGARDLLAHCASFPCKDWISAQLTSKYALLFREKETAVAHDIEWDQLSDCLPPGFPRTMINPFPRQFLVGPQMTVVTAIVMDDIRRIYTDGRGHVPEQESGGPGDDLQWDGDSIGFWNGDTLVVHTLYLKSQDVHRMGPRLSNELSVIEQIRMIDPNMMQDSMMIYDPLALQAPWHVVRDYKRITAPHDRVDMYSCEASNNTYQTKTGATDFILPGETITVQRSYRDPIGLQNVGVDKTIASGAAIMKAQTQAQPIAAKQAH